MSTAMIDKRRMFKARSSAILRGGQAARERAMGGQRQSRVCRACGARLAKDNGAGMCSPCTRAGVSSDSVPPKLPDGFWDRPEMRAALATRQFGKVLTAYRAHCDHKVTQADLGRWLSVSQVHVGRILRGISPVDNLKKLDRWSQVLGIPEGLLWFSVSPQSSDVYEPPPGVSSLRVSTNGEGNDVQRRQFLRAASTGATAVGASLLVAGRHVQPITGGADSADIPEVTEVRLMTQTFRHLDNRFGGGHSKASMTTYMTSVVERKLRDDRLGGPARVEFFSAAAELYQLAGWMAYDTGQAGVGRQHMRHALRLSQDAGNSALAAEMLAGMSHHAAFHGAPEDAVDLALAARQLAKASGIPALTAESAVMEAHGLALRGDKAGCLNALRMAEGSFMNADRHDTPAWLGYFDEAYLAAKFAHSFRDLGQPRQAETFARRSLEMSDGYERGKLFNTALLASILADQKRVEEASAIGLVAVTMTSTVRSVRSSAYLADVAQRLAPFRDAAEVKTLYGHLIAAGVPVPTS